jgi:hypothetical protein
MQRPWRSGAANAITTSRRRPFYFLALLDAEGMGSYAAAYRDRYPLPTLSDVDSATARYVRILAGRALDGAALAEDLRLAGGVLPDRPVIAPGDDTEAVRRAARRFEAWFAALAGPLRAEAWRPERFEYGFSVAAPLADGEVVLTAREYDTGRLDWDAFDVAPTGTTLGAAGDPSAVEHPPVAGLATPVAYRGMPAARYWQFEDARVDFGDLSGPSEDLTRMLLVDFAIVYGGDHFVVPIDIDVGSIVRLRDDVIVVSDTFGFETPVHHVSEADRRSGRPGAFRLFELGAPGARSRWASFTARPSQ